MNEIGIKYDDIEKLVEQVKREGLRSSCIFAQRSKTSQCGLGSRLLIIARMGG